MARIRNANIESENYLTMYKRVALIIRNIINLLDPIWIYETKLRIYGWTRDRTWRVWEARTDRHTAHILRLPTIHLTDQRNQNRIEISPNLNPLGRKPRRSKPQRRQGNVSSLDTRRAGWGSINPAWWWWDRRIIRHAYLMNSASLILLSSCPSGFQTWCVKFERGMLSVLCVPLISMHGLAAFRVGSSPKSARGAWRGPRDLIGRCASPFVDLGRSFRYRVWSLPPARPPKLTVVISSKGPSGVVFFLEDHRQAADPISRLGRGIAIKCAPHMIGPAQ